MPKSRKLFEQREMFNPQGSLLEEQEEQLNDELRRALISDRQARQDAWRALDGDSHNPTAREGGETRTHSRSREVLPERCADRDRRKAAEKQFEMLNSSDGRVN